MMMAAVAAAVSMSRVRTTVQRRKTRGQCSSPSLSRGALARLAFFLIFFVFVCLCVCVCVCLCLCVSVWVRVQSFVCSANVRFMLLVILVFGGLHGREKRLTKLEEEERIAREEERQEELAQQQEGAVAAALFLPKPPFFFFRLPFHTGLCPGHLNNVACIIYTRARVCACVRACVRACVPLPLPGPHSLIHASLPLSLASREAQGASRPR